ncbi:SIS domain-containing protein [Streptomyces sp. NPDC005438]|uniref:SIS domain-containing protein n=1 Tax=Streptomyces sp. NPDC005438 TaxID=3156880 RepID=UPI0033A4B503
MAAVASRTRDEIGSQPECWLRAAEEAAGFGPALPRPGERVAVTGCGTSWFVAQSYAALREASGQGVTDAFAASEFPLSRGYDRVVAVTRSGTTTEVLELLAALEERGGRGARDRLVVLTADPGSPVVGAAGRVAVLEYADERSVVQTRFATSALVFLRAGLERHGGLPSGVGSVAEAVVDAESAVSAVLPSEVVGAGQWTFLGRGWTYGLALEAALKSREAAGAWTEAYPAMEYRHGPIAVAEPGRVVWVLGEAPAGLRDEVERLGGVVVADSGPEGWDPLADLVRAQGLAVALAEARGLDVDRPRNLTRSVVLG